MTISVGTSADEAQPLVAIGDQKLIQGVLSELARPGRWYEPEGITTYQTSKRQGARESVKNEQAHRN
jgi:hypothetical protein